MKNKTIFELGEVFLLVIFTILLVFIFNLFRGSKNLDYGGQQNDAYPPPPSPTFPPTKAVNRLGITSPEITPQPYPLPNPSILPTQVPLPTKTAFENNINMQIGNGSYSEMYYSSTGSAIGSKMLFLEQQMNMSEASTSNLQASHLAIKIQDPYGWGTRMALSHNGGKIAYVFIPESTYSRVGVLYTLNMDSSDQKKIADQVDIGRWTNYPIWSPDAQWIAFTRGSDDIHSSTQSIVAINMKTNEENILVTADKNTWLWPLDWSQDGQYFYYFLGFGQATLWRVNPLMPGSKEAVNTVKVATPACYTISPDGKWILCSGIMQNNPDRYGVFLISTNMGEMKVLIDGATRNTYNPIWNTDVKGITLYNALSVTQGEIDNVDVESGVVSKIVDVKGGDFMPVSWSPDGRWLVTQFIPDMKYFFWVNSDGSQIVSLTNTQMNSFIGWIK